MEEVWEDQDFEERIEARISQGLQKEKLQTDKFYKFLHVFLTPNYKKFIRIHLTVVVHEDISSATLVIDEIKSEPHAKIKVKEITAGSAKKSKEDEFEIKKGIKLAVYRAIQASNFLSLQTKKEIYSKFRSILTKFD